MSSPGTAPCQALPAHRARRPKPSSSWEEEDAEEPPLPGRGRSALSQRALSSFYAAKNKDDTRGRELARAQHRLPCPLIAGTPPQ